MTSTPGSRPALGGMRRGLPIAASLVVGLLVGAGVTLAIAPASFPPAPVADRGLPRVPTAPAAPTTFLAWTPGGLPAGFRHTLAELPGIRRAVVVRSDVVWLTRSYSTNGEVVDRPPAGYAIPLEVASVKPSEYARFVPPADRGTLALLSEGGGILGASSARLRGLGPGAVLELGAVRVPVLAVWPDELVGANELLVARDLGRSLGVRHDRYALIQPRGEPSVEGLARVLRRALPPELPVQVRAPGETPYFRQGDAVLPPVALKELFGEFAARPDPNRRGYLLIDPSWEATHIATERVPLLGRVTCNVALIPQLNGAMRELVARGLGDTIRSYSGCYARRFANRDPTQAISHHTWGIAIDVNVPENPYGAPPDQDPRLVAVMERWGFIWGGTFVRPDGMHFEYHRPPARSAGAGAR